MQLVHLAAALLLAGFARAELWCKDAQGNNVEWSLIYKVPNTISAAEPTKSDGEPGTQYGYIDSNLIARGVTSFTSGNADGIFVEADNPLANSLQPIFKWDKSKANQEIAYIAYNDQPPEDAQLGSEISGHTKGVVVFDSHTGLWIVHSVPKFPQQMFSGKYSFPENGHVNGQTLLCMTFNSEALDVIATHLLNQNPDIYEANAPASILASNPHLETLLKKNHRRNETSVLETTLRGIGGTPFLAFAKSAHLDDDVYSVSIAPALKSTLLVSSWQNGEGGKLKPECDKQFQVLDVESVDFRIGEAGVSWQTKHDHSKWAVSRNPGWLCIGSINRMHSQFKRGGETVCLAEQKLSKTFIDAISSSAGCDRPTGWVGRLRRRLNRTFNGLFSRKNA